MKQSVALLLAGLDWIVYRHHATEGQAPAIAVVPGAERAVQGDNGEMTEKEMIRRWVQTWKEVGPELEKIRLREVRDEDNLLSPKLLAPAFEHAARSQPPDESPGLVEMQRHLAKLRQ